MDVGILLECNLELFGVGVNAVAVGYYVKEFLLYVDEVVQQLDEVVASGLVPEMGCEVGVFHHLLVSGDKPLGSITACNNLLAAGLYDVAYPYGGDVLALHRFELVKRGVVVVGTGLVDVLVILRIGIEKKVALQEQDAL